MKNLSFIVVLLSTLNLFSQPCYNSNIVTSAYATGGDGLYKDDILWLTWGGKDANNPYGKPDQNLVTGAKSYGSIYLGNDKYLCIEATLEKISTNNIKSYKPGAYSGDSKDNWYNIGGINNNNQLISGISNSRNGDQVHFKIKCKATISGEPVKLKGIVVADAESMASTEYIRAKASGDWNVLEVKKNLSAGGNYYIRKDVGRNMIQFGGGNDLTTAALSLLKFNELAYIGNDFEVEIEVVLKGAGNQAIALGLITPDVDFGDAPDFYGHPLHTLEKMTVSNDNVNIVGSFSLSDMASSLGVWNFDANNRRTNINSASYTPAEFNNLATSSYLGTSKAENNIVRINGHYADQDGLGTNEEDAWPDQFKRFSYKANFFVEGEQLNVNIKYYSDSNAYVTGWIDFNGDGKFGSNAIENVTKVGTNITRNSNTHNEFAFASVPINTTNNGITTLTWTIPKDRITRGTYVRLRIAENFNEIASPISDAIDGEIEDHRIFIMAPIGTNPVLKNKIK